MNEQTTTPEPWEVRFQRYCEAARIDSEATPNRWYEAREAFREGHAASGADKLREVLELLVHLHLCEQEGIGSAMPTAEQWDSAVKKAGRVLRITGGEPDPSTEPTPERPGEADY